MLSWMYHSSFVSIESRMIHYYYVDINKEINVYEYDDMLTWMYDFSFASIESGILHFKNRIGVEDIFTKRGESGRVDYSFRGSKP